MIEIKQGDTRHAIQAILMKANGTPVDLSSASVRIVIGRRGQVVLDRPVAQTETPGEVWYVFSSGETDIPGFYEVEFIVTYADQKVETFPNNETIKLRIRERIGGL